MWINKVLKFLSSFIAGVLIVTGLTFFIFSFILSYGSANLDDLKGSFNENLIAYASSDELDEDLAISPEIKQSLELCKSNPEIVECELLEKLKIEQSNNFITLMNNQIASALETVKEYTSVINYIRIISLIFILLGIGFLYLAHLSIIKTIYYFSIKSSITAWLAVVYYLFLPKFLSPNLIDKFINDTLPRGLITTLLDVILSYITAAFRSTMIIALTLAIVFTLLAIGFYILKKKHLNKEENQINQDGKSTITNKPVSKPNKSSDTKSD
jgi:hypothetical protein